MDMKAIEIVLQYEDVVDVREKLGSTFRKM